MLRPPQSPPSPGDKNTSYPATEMGGEEQERNKERNEERNEEGNDGKDVRVKMRRGSEKEK